MKRIKGKDFFRVDKVRVSITDEDRAIETIKEAIHNKQTGYVCISTVRTVAYANKNSDYREVMEQSIMNTPDGTPLVWCGHWWGLKEVKRACGPHIFPRMLKDNDSQLKHFFLGDTEETLGALKKKASEEYGAIVVGTYSPPFKPLEEYDIKGIARMINESGATIVWTALTAPKQDILNHMITPYLNEGIIMVGVGAAFRSVLGVIKQPDGVLQKMGLAGILFKRPERKWSDILGWYAKHVCYLLRYYLIIKKSRITAKNYWE